MPFRTPQSPIGLLQLTNWKTEVLGREQTTSVTKAMESNPDETGVVTMKAVGSTGCVPYDISV